MSRKIGLNVLSRILYHWKIARSKRRIKIFIRTTFGAIAEALEEGDSVVIPNFGKFELAEKRGGITPQGVRYENSKHIKFTPSRHLNAYVSGDLEINPIIQDLEAMLSRRRGQKSDD